MNTSKEMLSSTSKEMMLSSTSKEMLSSTSKEMLSSTSNEMAFITSNEMVSTGMIPVSNTEPPPRCQVQLQCTNKCCPATRCPGRAQYRVSFRCTSPACDHAADLVLACESCAARAGELGPVLARRPL